MGIRRRVPVANIPAIQERLSPGPTLPVPRRRWGIHSCRSRNLIPARLRIKRGTSFTSSPTYVRIGGKHSYLWGERTIIRQRTSWMHRYSVRRRRTIIRRCWAHSSLPIHERRGDAMPVQLGW